MEVIYPRDTRRDGVDSGMIGETNIVNDNSLNQTFYDYLTQYFDDHSKSVIETIYNTYNELPNVGVNELLFAYLQRIENELKNIRETSVQNTDRVVEKLLEIHSVVDLGEYTWNDFTEHIFMLTGGVPSSITINQYIANICAVVQIGSEFQTVDAATGLASISLYDTEYVQQLIDSGGVLDIGADKYVLLTACEIQVNGNDLGGQLGDDTQTEDDTSVDLIEDVRSFYYNFYAVNDPRKITSSDDWFVPSSADWQSLFDYVNGAVEKLKKVGADYWDNDDGTDDYGFGFSGNGQLSFSNGYVALFKKNCVFWTSTSHDGDEQVVVNIFGATNTYLIGKSFMKNGNNLRFCKDASGVPDGSVLEYVGNNGRVYNAIALGGKYWTPDICETLYRDHSFLTYTLNGASWVALGANESFATYYDEPYQLTTNGSVSGVDENGNLNVMSLAPAGELNEPKTVSELGSRHLIPVFMRKIT